MLDFLQPKLVVKMAPSTAMKRNWKKVMMFPEEGSSLCDVSKVQHESALLSTIAYLINNSKKMTFAQQPKKTKPTAVTTTLSAISHWKEV